jgi:hypothetical protein
MLPLVRSPVDDVDFAAAFASAACADVGMLAAGTKTRPMAHATAISRRNSASRFLSNRLTNHTQVTHAQFIRRRADLIRR